MLHCQGPGLKAAGDCSRDPAGRRVALIQSYISRFKVDGSPAGSRPAQAYGQCPATALDSSRLGAAPGAGTGGRSAAGAGFCALSAEAGL